MTVTNAYQFAIVAFAAAALLAGCGGGGGSTSSASPSPSPTAPDTSAPTKPDTSAPTPPDTSTPTAPATPTREDFALLTSSPAATYSDGGLAIYSLLNKIRLAGGAGALRQNAKLDAAAAAHLNYMKLNQPYYGHAEEAGNPGFTGANPWDRMTAAGYSYADNEHVSESINKVSADSPEFCVQSLLNTVYHQQTLMGAYRDVGIAYGEIGGGQFACALNFGVQTGQQPQMADAGALKVSPSTSGDATLTFGSSWHAYLEMPNPMPDVGTQRLGTAVFASMRGYGATDASGYTITNFTLRDSQGNAVPARVIVGNGTSGSGLVADALINPGNAVLVPLAQLEQKSTYTVEFSGANGSVPYAKTWTFTTY